MSFVSNNFNPLLSDPEFQVKMALGSLLLPTLANLCVGTLSGPALLVAALAGPVIAHAVPSLVSSCLSQCRIKRGLNEWCKEVQGTAEYEVRVKASKKILDCYFSKDTLLLKNLSSLPKEIGSLVGLQGLCIQDCSLTSLPKQISNLVNLQQLSIVDSALTSLPKEIGQLRNLRTFCINRCPLTSLPKEISNLVNLQELSILNSALTSLPEEIGDLVNLQHLDLQRNPLIGLPEEIGDLTNLLTLNIRGSNILVIPEQINNLPNLQQFSREFTPWHSFFFSYRPSVLPHELAIFEEP